MARSLLAIIAAAAFGIVLVMPDDASARAGTAGGSRSAGGFHRAGAAPVVRRSAIHHRHPGFRSRMAVRNRALFGWPGDAVGAGLDGSATPAGYGGSGCYVERRQINDDYGWRVREGTVCPGRPGGR